MEISILGSGGCTVIPKPLLIIQPGIFKQGLKQLINSLRFILLKFHRYKPVMYVMHTDVHDPDLLAKFNSEGWINAFINIAQLLKTRIEIKGIYGATWFYDPKIAYISPRLKFISEILTDGGARVFYIGPSEETTKDALTKSETRRKLYAEGKYIPTAYICIWPRKELIKWANRITTDKEQY